MARNALRKHGRALSAKADAERAELQSQLAGETTQAKLRAAAAEDEKQAFLEKSGAMEEEHEQMRKRLQARLAPPPRAVPHTLTTTPLPCCTLTMLHPLTMRHSLITPSPCDIPSRPPPSPHLATPTRPAGGQARDRGGGAAARRAAAQDRRSDQGCGGEDRRSDRRRRGEPAGARCLIPNTLRGRGGCNRM